MRGRSFFLSAFLASLPLACSAGDNDDDGDGVSAGAAASADVRPEGFDLYESLDRRPLCNRHTRLELFNFRGSFAKLREEISDDCPVAFVGFDPSWREYPIRPTRVECGSRFFAGKMTKDGKRWSVVIGDHRDRDPACEPAPARVVVEETAPTGIRTLLGRAP